MEEATDEQCQQNRTFLRERFLRMLTSLSNCKAEFELGDKNTVEATLKACDVDILQIQVEDLKTALGRYDSVLLRTTDILSISVDCDSQKPDIQTSLFKCNEAKQQ